MNRDPMIQRSPRHTLCTIAAVLTLFSLLVPFASAANPTPSATVPPVLLACSHAKYPEANFTCGFPMNWSPDGPPYTIACTDNSTSESDQPIVSWLWEFGDGGTSTVQHPKHTYAEAKLYDIRLTVTTWCGSKYSNKSDEGISIHCSVPKPGFKTNVTEGFAPLAVQITDASLGTQEDITTWTYWFDDTHFSHKRNPVFVYTQPGTYTINQSVWKDCVQVSSDLYPPSTRQVIVHAVSPISIDEGGTNTTPRTTRTGARPVATTPAGTLAVPVSVAPAETTQNAPPATGTGTLSVSTEPAGVQISIDGVPRGTSPATVPGLSTGSHTLRLEREGYYNQTVSVLIYDGQTNTVATTLAPVPGGIAILPVIAMTLIVLGIAGFGIYLYRKQKRE